MKIKSRLRRMILPVSATAVMVGYWAIVAKSQGVSVADVVHFSKWLGATAVSLPERTYEAFRGPIFSFVWLAQLLKTAILIAFIQKAVRSTIQSVIIASIIFWIVFSIIDPFSYSDVGVLMFYLVLALVLLAGCLDFLEPRKKESDAEKRANCSALHAALLDSNLVIENYRKFLRGESTWEEMMSHLTTIGNAFQGVVGEGRRLPPVVQEAVEEVERFDFGEEGVQGTSLLWIALTGTDEALRTEKARIEIQRQEHFNSIVARKQSEIGCSK